VQLLVLYRDPDLIEEPVELQTSFHEKLDLSSLIIMIIKIASMTIKLIYKQIKPYNKTFLFHYLSRRITLFYISFPLETMG